MCLLSLPKSGLWCCGPWQVHDHVRQLRPMTWVRERDLDFIMRCLEWMQNPSGWIILPTIHADGDAFARQAFAKFNFRPSLSMFGGGGGKLGRRALAAARGVESVQ